MFFYLFSIMLYSIYLVHTACIKINEFKIISNFVKNLTLLFLFINIYIIF